MIELAIGAVNAKIDNVNFLSPTPIPLYEYEVIDVYSAFNEYQPSSMGEVTYMYSENPSERDIHPNQNGQNIIFSLIKDLME